MTKTEFQIQRFEKIIIGLIRKEKGPVLDRLVAVFRALTCVALDELGTDKTLALFEAINRKLKQDIYHTKNVSELH